MISLGLMGCGRIGLMHAQNILVHDDCRLGGVYDIDAAAAERASQQYQTKTYQDPQSLASNPSIDALLIASATPTHADFIEMAVAAGKPVLCEKPIDLDITRVRRCAKAISSTDIPVQIGFNRRFDPGHQAARMAFEAGDIGDLHQLIISSRDPEMPPFTYYSLAGGLLRDMTIHDFDLARFFLPEEPIEIFATAEGLIDPPMMRELADHDTAMIVMRTRSGIQCHINNSRTAIYGYDQRVELLGRSGMLQSANRRPNALHRYTKTASAVQEPYYYFFIERYQESFMAELSAFCRLVRDGGKPLAGFDDGYKALLLAEAAYLSIKEQRLVRISEIE